MPKEAVNGQNGATAQPEGDGPDKALLSEHPLLRSVTGVLPLHVIRRLRAELHLAGVRMGAGRVEHDLRNARHALVNIGCGDHGRDGWVNLDGWRCPSVTHVYDCRRKIPLPDNAAKGIFTEHFVEHLHYTEEVPSFLSECFRTLEPGGVVRIVVPDTEGCMRGYFMEDWVEKERARGYNCDTRMERINDHFRQDWQHLFAWDAETLMLNLRRAGFPEVVHQQAGSSLLPEICIDSEHRRDGSLYVEGRK